MVAVESQAHRRREKEKRKKQEKIVVFMFAEFPLGSLGVTIMLSVGFIHQKVLMVMVIGKTGC